MITMRKFLILGAAVSLFVALAHAQSRGGNWPTYAGDAQRSGWVGADARITKETVKDLQLLFKLKLETQAKGTRPLMPPVILGRLISYRGFRELAFVGSNADLVYAIDADLGTVFWQKHLEYSTRDPQVTTSTAECPGGMTAMPTMPIAGTAAPQRGGPFSTGPASVYAISSDGRLHRLNTSTGDDVVQPVQVLPANTKAANLNLINNVIYTVTSSGCNETADAVWAIDLTADVPKVSSYGLKSGESSAAGGPVIGADGTVYVRTSERLLALTGADLAPKGSFAAPGEASPAVFQYKNRELLVVADKEGLLSVFDASLFRGNLIAPLSQTAVGNPVSGNLSTWQDAAGVRWIFAPSNKAITAYKIEEQGGKPVLTQGWVSREMSSPMQPVITSGVVFAVTAGGSRATLYVLDAATGKELYSSRNLIGGPASLAGISASNGRVYFGTRDGTFYAFGMYLEH